MNAYFTYSYDDLYTPDYFIEFEWEFDMGTTYPDGDNPFDLVTIEWDSDDYLYDSKYINDKLNGFLIKLSV